MSTARHPTFERMFEPQDLAVFNELTRGLVGTKLTRWRETYGEGLVFDFGPLIPRRIQRSHRIPQDRGQWVVSSWGCDLAVTDQRGDRTESREGSFVAIKATLAGLVGAELVDLSLNLNDLSLTMRFSNSAQIDLLTDPADPEVDQWFIQLPSWQAVGVSASGRWYLEEDS